MFLFLNLASAVGPEPSEEYLIFNSASIKGGGCYRIPSLVTAKNGTVIAFIDLRPGSCGDLNYNNKIKIAARHSYDDGVTWSDERMVADYGDNLSSSDSSSILNTQTGEIVVLYNFWNYNTEKGIYKQHVKISSDNGETWGEPIDITDQIAPPDSQNHFKFITSGKGAQAKTGYLYQALVDVSAGNSVYLIESKNGGRNWTRIDVRCQVADETTLIPLENGNILLNARTFDHHRRFFEIDPVNQKLVKQEDRPDLVDPNCDAGFMKYYYGKSNIVFFSNANNAGGRSNMTIKYSLDDAKTFSSGKVVQPGGGGYSSITVNRKYEVVMLYENPGKNGIIVRNLSMNWVLNQ